MTARNEDPNLMMWLRSLQADVARLKAGAGVKQNNIRLGDWVCDIDDDGCLVATNVHSGVQTITCATNADAEIQEIVWSSPGALDQDWLDSMTTDGPVWYPPADIVAVECGMFIRNNTMTGGEGITVQFITHGAATMAETRLQNLSVDNLKCYQTPPATGVPEFDTNGIYRGEWFFTTAENNILKNEAVSIVLQLPEGITTSMGDDLTVVFRYRFT